jgi:phosphohistidine phosphatase
MASSGKTRSILLMRHAKASLGEPDLPDHDRPLNKRGKQSAPFMGALLREKGLVPDIVVTSTARRAVETSDLVVSSLQFDGEILSTSRLYLAEPSNYFDLFAEVPLGARSALFVAHNPGIAELVFQLTAQRPEMCTAGVAHISCQVDEIARLDRTTKCELVAFYRPPRQ